MIKIVRYSLLAGIIYFASCTREAESKQEVKIVTEVVEEVHQHDTGDVIQLNNGAKWKVTERMIAFIRLMEADVKNFNQVKLPGMKDYNALGVSLQKNIDSLTSNCTMTGKAHDELHKWLLPYIDLVDELNKAKNEQDAAKVYADLQASYITFNAFFE